MRAYEFLTERKEFTYYNTQDVAVAVHKNPTYSEIINLINRAKYDKQLRGILLDNFFYVWDAGLATHYEIAKCLGKGMVECYGFDIFETEIYYRLNSALHNEPPEEIIEKFKQLFPLLATKMDIKFKYWKNYLNIGKIK